MFALATTGVAKADVTTDAATQALLASAVQFEHAEGVPRDYQKAAAMYCEAAKRGSANAQFSLGWMYANGRGVVKSDAIASHLFSMASKQGHVAATSMMQFAPVSKAGDIPKCLTPEPAKLMAVVVPDSSFPAPAVYNNRDSRAIFQMVEKIAKKHDVDPQLVMAVIAVESGFNVNARSPKNAQGLMQLIPETAQRFNVKNTLDAEENIRGGIAYLKWLLAFFKGNVEMVAAAYNSGERTVERYRGIPPYPETQNYVRKIARLYQKTDHPYQSGLVKASPFLANRKPAVQ
ncbi:MAG: lytic transglycosylase domain-containing protein [Pseudomonadota bacterium]